MSVIPSLALLGAAGWLIWQRLHTLLAYFQQDEYDAARFWPALAKVRLYDILASACALIALILWAMTGPLAWLLLALAFGLIALREARYVFKKPLVQTARAMRILHLAAALMALPVALAALWPMLFLLVLQLPPLALMLANRALAPRQEAINAGFISEARAKLARMAPITIGITGSFGKTTVKHMLAELLEASAPVFFSRGSINTELGLTRHIRQRLQWGHKYFIAEMGAYGLGSVQRLCDFARPDYGIVTSVGDAHTERFGSIEVIAEAKSELVADLCQRGGIAVIDAALLEHAPFARLHDAHPHQVLTVGRGAADIVIRSAEQREGYWHICLTASEGQIPDVSFSIPLLGAHNVMNAALVMTLALLIAPEAKDQITASAAHLEQIPHRLQKREMPGEPLILDDAYNSNEAGFLSALKVARDLARARGGKAILITPGLAELGDKHDPVHRALGEAAAQECDAIIAVNPERIRAFCDAAARVDAGKLKEVPDLAAARGWLKEISAPEDVVLYENDLPDLLETRRLL